MSLDNNNHHHKACGFAEEAVAYLYGEIEASRKHKFESHLAKCESCADELEHFTALRSGIGAWKNQFDKLPTPVFEVSYNTSARTVETEKPSFFDSLKNFLSFSPALATVAAAIVFAMLIGFGFLIFNSGTHEELAANEKAVQNEVPEIIEEIPSPFDEEKNQDPPAPETASNETNAPENVGEKIPAPKKTEQRTVNRPRPQTVAVNTPKAVKKDAPKPKTRAPRSIEENSPVQAQKLPKLNTLPDDEETDELRLSDLLSDLDAK